MSQFQRLQDGTVLPDVETLTGNAGGAVGPDAAFNIDLLGGNNITATGTPLTNTITFDVTGTTDNALQVGNATGSLTSLAVGLTGELLIGNTGVAPGWGTTSYGDFSFTNLATPATPRMLAVINLDTDVLSLADLRLSVPPGNGDGCVSWEVQGTLFYAAGVDNSVAGDPWKLSNSSSPSGGTALITANSVGEITFNEVYEFPNADGTANYPLVTDGAGNLDFTVLAVAGGGTGLTDLDVDNVIYVTKSGNDGNTGRDINHALLTIQAAVTLANAGDTILVYPGTYTETITHADNNVTVIGVGQPATCIITQADANVVNFVGFTGIVYENFTVSCTAATTAIWTVEGTTGDIAFRDCTLNMTCATAIAAVAQPGVGRVTGAGTFHAHESTVTYAHTGNGGGTAQKGAFSVANGGSIHLDLKTEITIANSGTALVSAVGIDLASTGVFHLQDCIIEVTDPNATVISGLAYLGGTGINHEYYRNQVHVIATNNIGYGFFSADTASTSRFFYNHIHVTDVAGTSYSYAVGNGATVVAQFDDIIAADGVQIVAGGSFTEVASEIDGNLTCQSLRPAGTVLGTIANTDNTATAGNAALNLSVGGTTSTGDPYVNWLITGSNTFSMGIDNSTASDNLKITDGATPSAGDTIFELTGYGANQFANFFVEILDLTISNAGDRVQINCQNNDNTNAASNAYFRSAVGGASAGDPFFYCQIVGGTDYSFGIDNSDSDILKITDGATPSAGNTLWQMTTAGERTMPLQPAFSAFMTAAQVNATGAGASYKLCDDNNSTIYDQNADYDDDGIFTAPVTGRYFMRCQVYVTTTTAAMTDMDLRIITSNRTYYVIRINPDACERVTDGTIIVNGCAECDMDATDTCTFNVIVSSGVGDTASVGGAATNPLTGISGHLMF